MSSWSPDGGLRMVDSLHRLRDLEDRQAKGRLQQKRMQIHKLKEEIEGLRRRREAVLGRAGRPVLRERLLLDALMKIAIERARELEALHLQAAALLSDYREAKGRLDAVAGLRDRRRAEREVLLGRRAEEVAGDAAALRRSRAAAGAREDS